MKLMSGQTWCKSGQTHIHFSWIFFNFAVLASQYLIFSSKINLPCMVQTLPHKHSIRNIIIPTGTDIIKGKIFVTRLVGSHFS